MSMLQLFAEQETVQAKFVSKNNVAFTVLTNNRLDDLPYVEAQEELEALFDKNQAKKRIRFELDNNTFTAYYDLAQLPEEVTREFCLQLCTHMCILKRASASTLIGILYHHFEDGRTRQDAMQMCATALELCAHGDMVDYVGQSEEFVVRFQMTAETQRDLDRFQYPLPMVTQPKRITHNRQNGYRSDETSKSLVVLKAGRETAFYQDADVCLDHLNRMNSIPFTLNTKVVELIDNEWSDLDKKRPGEMFEDYEKRVKAFKRYDAQSKDVVHALSQLRDKMWLTHKYDRRGRVYCQGYHVNYQGNPWNKAAVEFAEKELIE